jgi:hypothetical protein
MKQALLIVILAAAVLGGWLLLSSTTSTVNNSSQTDSRGQVLVHEMQQLTAAFDDSPFQPVFGNHKYIQLDDGTLMFIHFDGKIGEEAGLLYIGQAVPGVFCDSDQQRANEKYGDGFTHFHTTNTPGATEASAGHGGVPNADGYWFRHVAVDSFDRPWGRVNPGIDHNFMPTPPPSC